MAVLNPKKYDFVIEDNENQIEAEKGRLYFSASRDESNDIWRICIFDAENTANPLMKFEMEDAPPHEVVKVIEQHLSKLKTKLKKK